MRSVSVLLARLAVGGFLAGHGAQKLFGWFGGEGFDRTAGRMAALRLQPGTAWARLAGGSELGGGMLTVLGFLNPLGPIAAIGAMAMAWTKVHLGKPVWNQQGGAELPLTNLAILSGLTLAGPGRLSLDSLLGIRIPRRIGVFALAAALGAVWMGARREIEAGTALPPAPEAASDPVAGLPVDAADVAIASDVADAVDPRPMRGVMADDPDGPESPAGAAQPGSVPWTGRSGADVATAGSVSHDDGGNR